MKMLNRLLFPILFSTLAFSQSSSYSLGYEPLTTLTNLKAANTIHDISPLLWRFMGLPAKDRFELDFRRKQDAEHGYYLQTPENNYPKCVEVVFVEMVVISKGKASVTRNTGEALTSTQKYLLNTADMSSNIDLTIWFVIKNNGNDQQIKKGRIAITVVPDVEAQYPEGGSEELIAYLTEYVARQYPSNTKQDIIQNASVLFTVAEDGSLVDIQLRQLSGDPQIDKLLLEAFKQMPKWKPAQNEKGLPVKQKIHFALGSGGC